MVRPNTQLYPSRAVAPLHAAATVLLLRDTPQGLEVLMTRRSMTASFAPGAYVFPGGGIDALDAKIAQNTLKTTAKYAQIAPESIAYLHGNATPPDVTQRSTQTPLQCMHALAAIRESFEELGILLAKNSSGAWCTQADIDALDRTAEFYGQIAAQGHRLCADAVFTLAHWITDRDLPRRFEVPFLVAPMPPGQHPLADEAEQFEPLWVRPADALQRHAKNDFFIIFPTIRTLDRLQNFASVDAVLKACASGNPLWTSSPRAGLRQGLEERYMEHESCFGELAMVCPDGQIAHALDWQHTKPVPLLKHVMRLTAPNPGMMTGPGTNTYIVGTAETGYIVIDPGPDDAVHVQRIFTATGGDIGAIVCTHSHADHSPAAKPLQALCTQKPPILGRRSAPTARQNAHFIPDNPLQNQELLTQYLRHQSTDLALKMTLKVIFTPGHAANHLCLVLQEDGLLFSGDHILNGSTTVIDPPDGNMTAYLDSLDTLAAACDEFQIDFILPAHGYVLTRCAGIDHKGGARRAIEALKAHRLQREAKVMAAMQKLPQGSIEALVPLAYDDVHPRLWPIAARSLAAHVERIRQLP